MTELKRLLVEPQRLKAVKSSDRLLHLNNEESHYLRRVLRLRNNDMIAVVDGFGHLWQGSLKSSDQIYILSDIAFPFEDIPRLSPLLCLAVVIPKRGFKDLLRMSCELGVDILQPLRSNRSTPQVEEPRKRWESILREAVEQSERLWKPQLLQTIEVEDWFKNSSIRDNFALATTRTNGKIEFQDWINRTKTNVEEVYVAIGPEGGWTSDEEHLAEESGCEIVHLGDSILRTETAGVAVTQTMVSWRRNVGIKE